MLSKEFSFELLTQDGKARLGKINTPRGKIDTPAFMPVGTQGTGKAVFPDDILETGSQIILGNTYHLLLRPGVKILDKFKENLDLIRNKIDNNQDVTHSYSVIKKMAIISYNHLILSLL